MKRFYSIIIIILILGCQKSNSTPSEKLIKNSKGEEYIAIIKGNREKYFVLTIDDINEIDKILNSAINKRGINLSKYKRQYVPNMNANGEKEVYVNCFCMIYNDTWKSKYYFGGNGGGDCFFGLNINLKNQAFSDFWTNATY